MGLEKLDKRVGIYAPTESTNSSTGEVTESFALSTTAWMEMISDSGDEVQVSNQEINKHNVKWRVRSGHTINERYKLYWNSEYYDILHIDQSDRYFWILTTVKNG